MIIDGYLWHQTIKPALVALVLLTAIFFCYATAKILNDIAGSGLDQTTILQLAVLQILIAAPILLPTAYYLGIVFSLSRLYRESELIIMLCLGWSEWRLARSIVIVAVVLAICTGILTIWLRPLAYRESYRIEEKFIINAQMQRTAPGSFTRLGTSGWVLNAKSMSQNADELLHIFLHRNGPIEEQVVIAERGSISQMSQSNSRQIQLHSGSIYGFSKEDGGYSERSFDELRFIIENPSILGQQNRRRGEPTSTLARATTSKEAAEFHWRISTPLAVLLLSALAIPLSRTNQRESGNKQLFFAVIAYAAVFYSSSVVTGWVETGILDAVPGIWSVWIILLLCIGLLYAKPMSLPS